MNSSLGILKFLGSLKLHIEIPQGGWGMTERDIPQKGILVEFKLRNSKIPYRDPRVKLGDDTVGNFEFLEIAPSTLLPRNDGIFEFSVMSSLRGAGG